MCRFGLQADRALFLGDPPSRFPYLLVESPLPTFMNPRGFHTGTSSPFYCPTRKNRQYSMAVSGAT